MRESLGVDQLREVYDDTASRYDAQHKLATLNTDQRGRRMVVEHGVRKGDRVLDAGGGTGSTALMAAERVGPSGHVTLFDLSGGMIDVARERAERTGLADRMSFRAGDMLDLPFDDASFDVVLSTYSVCPLYDPKGGALELYRVVRPGGRLAAAHSAEPPGKVSRLVGGFVERVAWRFPKLSLGCRPVSVLPALTDAGATVLYKRLIGLPFMPFLVFVVRRPSE